VRARGTTAAALALVIVSACDGGGDDELSGSARIYIAAVRSVAERMPVDAEDREKLPVVYVVSNDAEPIAADVQAEVANALDKDADVRFADARVEALDLEKPHEPVRGEGRLLTVGRIEDDADVVDLQVEIYRSDEEWSRGVVTLERSAEDWAVTSSSIVEVVTPSSSVPGSSAGSSVPDSSVPAATTTST